MKNSKQKKSKYTSIGGQALMEGIMMRGPEKTVMCVRRADGSMVTEEVANGKKRIWNKIPIIRGVAGFIDSMVFGTKMLMRSAEIAIEDELAAAKAAEEETAEQTEAVAAEAAAAQETESKAEEMAEKAASELDVAAEEAAIEATAEAAAEEAESKAEEVVEKAASELEAAAEEAAIEATATEAAEQMETVAQTRQKQAEPKHAEAKKNNAKGNGKKGAKKSKEKKKSSDSDSGFLMFLATVLGFGLAILLFFFAPTWCSNGIFTYIIPNTLPEKWVSYFASETVQQVWRPIIEGIVKLIIFIIYLLLCASMKEIKTLFRYHGAEHKTIFCYEAGEELTVENVRKHKRFHPRCGTSFLILMLLIGIAAGIFVKFSALPDSVKNSPIFYPLIKIALIPVIMGVGYELLKFAGRHDNILTRIISAPGLWVQRITTKEPTDEQIECAIAALKPVIPTDGSDMQRT